MKSENMLESVETNRSYIPNFCTTVLEQSMYVAEGAELIFNEMIEQVGIEELAVYESTGSVVVYEGAKLDELKKTLLAALDKLWATIKHSFEQMIAKVKKSVLDKKFDAITRETVAKLPADLKLPDIHEYPGLKESEIKKFASNAAKVRADIKNLKPVEGNDDNYTASAAKNELSMGGNIYARVAGVDGATSAADIKKELKEKLVGSKKGINAKMLANGNMLIDMKLVVKGDATMKQIKSAYNEEKKLIDELKSEVKGMKDDFSDHFKVFSSAIKDLVIALNTCHSIQIDAAFMQIREYGMVLAAAGASTLKDAKAAKKEAKKSEKEEEPLERVEGEVVESATIQEDLVATLFNW